MSHVIDKPSIIATYRIHEKDTGSSEVQIAILSARIRSLTDHLRIHRKDAHSRLGLLLLASRRRKLLAYLRRSHQEKYQSLIKQLKFRR